MKRGLRKKLVDLAGEIQKLPQQEQIGALALLIRHVADTPIRQVCYQIINNEEEKKDKGAL